MRATGIVDYRAVARAMADDVRAAGGEVLTGIEVTAIREGADAVDVATPGRGFRARRLVACAGLQADRVLRLGGVEPDFRIVPFRGEYYELPPARARLVIHLIYPVPDPDLPFLGVHLSPTIDGRITVGPQRRPRPGPRGLSQDRRLAARRRRLRPLSRACGASPAPTCAPAWPRRSARWSRPATSRRRASTARA